MYNDMHLDHTWKYPLYVLNRHQAGWQRKWFNFWRKKNTHTHCHFIWSIECDRPRRRKYESVPFSMHWKCNDVAVQKKCILFSSGWRAINGAQNKCVVKLHLEWFTERNHHRNMFKVQALNGFPFDSIWYFRKDASVTYRMKSQQPREVYFGWNICFGKFRCHFHWIVF